MERSPSDRNPPAGRARPYIGMYFRCCRIYQRIYRNPAGDRYVGFCPRCAGRVEVLVGQEGTTERIFQAE